MNMKKLESLKKIRKYRGLTQKELAEKSGVSLPTIRNLEEGNGNVDNVKLSTLDKLARALKVKIFDLLK